MTTSKIDYSNLYKKHLYEAKSITEAKYLNIIYTYESVNDY